MQTFRFSESENVNLLVPCEGKYNYAVFGLSRFLIVSKNEPADPARLQIRFFLYFHIFYRNPIGPFWNPKGSHRPRFWILSKSNL